MEPDPRNRPLGLALMVLFTLFSTAGQTFLKIGASPEYRIAPLAMGLGLYALGTVLFIAALRHGELSVLYPIVGLSFVWVTLVARFLLREPLTYSKVGGIVLIVLGVGLLGLRK